MTAELEPRDAIARIPDLRTGDVKIEALSGGLTNRTFKVTHGGEDYVLRLDAEHTPAFGLDRARELLIARNAAAGGIAPEIVFAEPDVGIFLTRFVEGTVWTVDRLGDTQDIERVAALLRRVHGLPSVGQEFDATRIAQRYLEWLESSPELQRDGATLVDSVSTLVGSGETRCCHNDVVAANIIGNGSLFLIDWEYACDNDPLFDLASLLAYHDLGGDIREVLLDAYLGGASRLDREQLEAQIRLYRILQWLWLAVRQTMIPRPEQALELDRIMSRLNVGV